MKIKNFADLMKYVIKYENNPRKLLKMSKNFQTYIDLCDKDNTLLFIDKVKNNPSLKTTLYYNSDYLCRKFGINVILKMTTEMDFKERYEYIHELYEGIRMKYYTLDEYIDDLVKSNETELVGNNIKNIINLSDIRVLIAQGLLKKLKQIDNENFNKMHSLIVSKMIGIKPEYLDTKILLGLTMIVDEIAQNENTDISSLEYIGEGNYTKVYKLGNKVIKFGKDRLTDKIPYHRRILQPLIRRKILKGSKDLYLEIAEYLEYDNTITDEDAYLVYKELREDGIIWVDAKKENLARLEKKNIVHFDKPIKGKSEDMGYFPETIKNEDVLKKGELVIIDTDCLFREQDFKKMNLDNYMHLNFYIDCEQKYQLEKQVSKTNKFTEYLDKQVER